MNFGDADGCAGLHHPGEERVAFLLRSSVSQHGLASGPWQRWWRRTHCEIARWRLYIYILYYIYYIYIYDNSKMTWDTFQRDFTSTEIRWVFAHLQFFCHDPSHGAETAALLLALPVARQLGEAAVGQLSTGAMANLLNSCRVVGINQQNMVLKWVYIYILVGGLEHLDYFSIYMGIIIFPFDFHIF